MVVDVLGAKRVARNGKKFFRIKRHRAKVQHRMVIWTYAHDVAGIVDASVRLAKRLDVMSFGIKGAAGKLDSFTANLAAILMKPLDSTSELGVSQNPILSCEDPWWRRCDVRSYVSLRRCSITN